MYLALASEAKDRGLVPKPQPIPPQNTSFDVEELGKILAKANKEFVAALATQGMIKTSPLKLHPLSGGHLKEDVSFEQWAYEVRLALKTHTEGSVREAMIQCLKGATLEGVRNLGDEASVEDILEYLTGTFQGTAPFDTLLKNFFQLQQEDSEKVAQYSIKLENKLASLKWHYPHALSSETELQYKRDRLFYGLHKNTRDSIRSSYKKPQLTYAELLRAAREIEEELGENSPQDSKPDKKAKVASTTVSSSTATELSKLAEVTLKCSQEQEKACKLMKELISLLKITWDLTLTLKAMGLGIEVEAGVVSEEAGVVEEMAGVISIKASKEAKMVVLAMVSKTSLEVPMVIRVRPIGLGLLSVSIVKSRRLTKLITGLLNASFWAIFFQTAMLGSPKVVIRITRETPQGSTRGWCCSG